jgi:hypothetical protein
MGVRGFAKTNLTAIRRASGNARGSAEISEPQPSLLTDLRIGSAEISAAESLL